MNETSDSVKKSIRSGSLFVFAGIMFCMMGGMKLVKGLVHWFAAEGAERHSGDLVIGGMFLAAGLINLFVGLQKRKLACEATKPSKE